MKLSVSVMAHPDRQPQVQRLLYRLSAGQPPLAWGAIPVGWDDEGPPKRDPERVWRTARRAWELHDPAADWHLLLQDDAIPCRDLLAGLAAGLHHVPANAVVSLYLGTSRPLPRLWAELGERADQAGAAWIVGPRSMWGVALAMPTRLIEPMVAYCDRQNGIPDDMRFGRWARRERLEAWFPWPSLVDHLDGDSLVGHGVGRVARRFLDGSALTDWKPDGSVLNYAVR